MLNIRTITVSILLVLMLIFAAGKAVSATTPAASTEAANKSLIDNTERLECATLPSRLSVHSVYVEATGMRVSYTEDGPTGMDGGLKYLLSAYRTCS